MTTKKTCRNCDKCQIRSDNGMVKYYCGSKDTYGVNGFHTCQNWTAPQERKVS